MTTITELTDEQIGDIYKTEFAVEDPGSSFVIRFARAIITASRAKSAALSAPATAPSHTEAEVQELLHDDREMTEERFEISVRRILGVPAP